MKVLSVVGARPQFIKAAAVSDALKAAGLKETLVHTGQHYDKNLSDIFFKELGMLKPKYNLGVGAMSHGKMTGLMLEKIEAVLLKEKPDSVLLYGDTNSTLAGALAASKLRIPIAHVEAGLRSFNLAMPEETNRMLTDKMSSLLFCPTTTAIRHLKNEGIRRGVYMTGDVMYDSILKFLPIAEKKSRLANDPVVKKGGYFYVTIHRAENTDVKERLLSILGALLKIAETHPVVLPLHPRTLKYLKMYGLYEDVLKKLKVIDPVGYLDNIMLMKHAEKVLTDSGGIQKEAYMLKVPCVTMRDETEWVETAKTGWNKVVGADGELILKYALSRKRPLFHPDLFGNGHASDKIAILLKDSKK